MLPLVVRAAAILLRKAVRSPAAWCGAAVVAIAAVVVVAASSERQILVLGELPRGATTSAYGIAGDDEGVFVTFMATREFDDEEHFLDAGLMQFGFDGHPGRRLATFDSQPGQVALDGQHAYFAHRGIRSIPREGGEPLVLHWGEAIRGLAGDELIVVNRASELHAVNTASGRSRIVSSHLPYPHGLAATDEHIYVHHRNEAHSLVRIEVRTGERREVGLVLGSYQYRQVVAGSGRVAALLRTEWETCLGALRGEEMAVRVCEPRNDANDLLAVDGAHIYYLRGTDLWRVSIEEGEPERFAATDGRPLYAAVAGDYLVWSVDHRVYAARRD